MIKRLCFIALFIAIVPSAHAISLVRKCPSSGIAGGGNTGTTVTCACASNATGNLIFVWGGSDAASPSLSVADTASNTYTNLTGNLVSGGRTLRLFAAYSSILSAGTNTITITSTVSGSNNYCGGAEYSGLLTASALDQTNNNPGSGTAWSSGAVTTTQASELMVGVAFGGNGTITLAAGTNIAWALEGSTTNGGESPGWEDFTASSIQTNVDAQFTYSLTTGGICAIVTFKATAAAGGGSSKKKKIIFY